MFLKQDSVLLESTKTIHMKLLLGLFSILIFFGGCQSDTITIQQPTHQRFFDLKGYVEQQATLLQQKQPSIKKTITSGSIEETKILQDIDWTKELGLFTKSDINKPSWADKYSIDSIAKEGGFMLLQYKAQDPDLATRQLDIELKGEVVHSVFVINQVTNAIYQSQQYLTYIPQKGYTIKKKQAVQLMDKDDYEIEVTFE